MTSPQNNGLHKEGFKQQRKNEVVLAALEIFSNSGIESTTMVDVAKRANVGVASVYRYFSTKFDLALAAAIVLWQDQINPYFASVIDETTQKESGLQQVMRLLNVTTTLYQELPHALRFLEYFDNFIVSASIDHSRLVNYAVSFGSSKSLFMEALVLGKKDGSIRSDLDQEAFYYTISHTLISLAQKLILRGDIVDSDEFIDKLDQVKIVIEMARTYIKNPQG